MFPDDAARSEKELEMRRANVLKARLRVQVCSYLGSFSFRKCLVRSGDMRRPTRLYIGKGVVHRTLAAVSALIGRDIAESRIPALCAGRASECRDLIKSVVFPDEEPPAYKRKLDYCAEGSAKENNQVSRIRFGVSEPRPGVGLCAAR